jgi:hypothetical protein
MKNERFTIRAYGKSELAMLYFPYLSGDVALKKFKVWLKVNPRLRPLLTTRGQTYTPKQVRKIVEEVGEPFEL